jgi:hypothetical protein
MSAEGRNAMDRITERYLTEFSAEHDLSDLDEAKRFERLALSEAKAECGGSSLRSE